MKYKSEDIDDGWTLSPELEELLTKPTKPQALISVIDLNSASVDELCSLPGIGKSRAKDIVRFRDANGPFESPSALLAISGIGARTLEALATRLRA